MRERAFGGDGGSFLLASERASERCSYAPIHGRGLVSSSFASVRKIVGIHFQCPQNFENLPFAVAKRIIYSQKGCLKEHFYVRAELVRKKYLAVGTQASVLNRPVISPHRPKNRLDDRHSG